VLDPLIVEDARNQQAGGGDGALPSLQEVVAAGGGAHAIDPGRCVVPQWQIGDLGDVEAVLIAERCVQ